MPSLEQARQRMEKALDAMRREFSSVRTGKATPALLDVVRVEAYGAQVPLNQVATIQAPEARLLLLSPFDRATMKAIEKAIMESGLGLNPSNDGKVIRVPIPALTEDRRREFVKVLHRYAEEGRVALRQARKDANDEIKRQEKAGDVSEDDARRAQDQVQKLTDQFSAKVEELLKHKEAEVMEV